ncbi:leucyl aminopeptidase family protein [Candidatus Peregrinibacteria bacterium]|nr:leucyl aminopeptidase family protein [Candidatus Peregrinibacteria bacterium]
MTVQQILKLLDPKNQNLPKISVDSVSSKYNKVNVLAFQGKEKGLEKEFACLKKEKISGKKGELKEVFNGKQILWVQGVGKDEKMTAREIRRLFGKIYLGATAGKPKQIAIMCPADWVTLAVLGIHTAALSPSILKTSPTKESAPEVILIDKSFKAKKAQAEKMIKEGEIMAEGKNVMRVLGALAPNILSTEMYASVIKAYAKQLKVPCQHLTGKQLKKYELLNAVSEGSEHESQLLILTLHPKNGKTKNATAMVGKGLCYDSGGLQGKGVYMKYMKEDMAGSASVLGAIVDIIKNKRNLKETTYFLLPLAENMMGNKAMRADDVWTAGDGQTVEIINTDAEGRLALADAMCYVKNNFKNVDKFMTIATLTGSCIIALGETYTGVVCNDEGLKVDVYNSADISGDFIHAAPWDMEYDDNNSPHADIANLGEKDRDAGWIKAGLFLARFLPKDKDGEYTAKFCHFDIAGSIDMKEAGKSWRKKGFSSGVGVGLLSDLLTK